MVTSTALFATGKKETGASTDGKIHLTTYMQIEPADSQYAGHNAIMEGFAAKYPNIVLDSEYASGEAFHQKFQAMAASGQMPDVFTVYGGARTAYITEAGLAMDIGKEYLTDDFKSQFSAATWATQGKNGEFWMVPPSLAVCHTVYSNDALLKQLGLSFPATYEEWLAQIPVIKKAGYYPVSMGNKDQWVVNSWLLSLLVDRLGGPEWFMNAAKGKASFTEKPFVRSLEIIKEMTDKGIFSPGVNQMSNSEADQEFYQGKSVYLIDAGWRTSGMDKDLSATMQSDISMHVFPEISGEVRHNTSTATVSEGFGINAKLKGTEKADAAWKFIQYYNGAEGAAIRAQYGEVPTYKLDLQKIKLATMQAKFAQFQSSHDMGYVFDAIMGSEGVSMLNQDIQAMMLGNGTPADIAAKYETYVAKNDSNRI
ncbi:extracellular solute-binding protein [uncultured Sphaerochaeta sp.]|uniref:ABC transporter substrate-binding protein n=1 Tax=uncultured Sphaerochaeta sp. TaxID=886478 RepID=UPI002A0A8478|nr:extracellular solute-binding protein [uncultured Sphaerochaeta sp.]